MDSALSKPASHAAQDRQITAAVQRERGRLLSFIVRTVRDAAEADDVLQEALYELVAALRLQQPVEHAGAWLRRVARNRIIDRFRRKTPEVALEYNDEGDGFADGLPPSGGDGPEAALLREVMMDQLELALDELPPEQRAVFLAHEIEGASFKELSARWGVAVNTLLSRKRYAVLRLRARLKDSYDEWLQD